MWKGDKGDWRKDGLSQYTICIAWLFEGFAEVWHGVQSKIIASGDSVRDNSSNLNLRAAGVYRRFILSEFAMNRRSHESSWNKL